VRKSCLVSSFLAHHSFHIVTIILSSSTSFKMSTLFFSDLNVYCLMQMFEYLPLCDQVRLTRVNRLFGELLQVQLHQRTELTINEKLVNNGQFSANICDTLSVFNYLPNLKQLTWSRVPLTVEVANWIYKSCPQLVELNLFDCNDTSGLVHLVTRINTIQKLNLKSVYKADAVQSVLNCSQLEHFETNLTNCADLIALRGYRLKSIILNGNVLNDQPTINAIAQCTNLEVLRINAKFPISVEHLTKLANSLRNLNTIELTVTSSDLITLATIPKLNSANLRFSLGDTKQPTTQKLLHFLSKANLSSLQLRNCDLCCDLLQCNLRPILKLRSLSIDFKESSLDDNNVLFFEQCPNLRKLRLVTSRLSPIGLIHLLRCCTKLRQLTIANSKLLKVESSKTAEVLRSYALKYPKRRIIATVSSDYIDTKVLKPFNLSLFNCE